MARKRYRLEDVVSLSQAVRRPYPQGERRELRQHSLTNGCKVGQMAHAATELQLGSRGTDRASNSEPAR